MTLKKILIANRGEIACRIAATCKRLGIKTVAVYSDVDAHARHTVICDEAIHIGGAEPGESYLCSERVIAAALTCGAQAIHPGYGFLSENAQFAKDCVAAGLIFIGPPAQAIEAMGSKSAAKALMEKAGIPLVPGYHGLCQDADFLQQQAQAISYPILLKASAGGGGKGMRIVMNDAEFKDALRACQREAQHSFGDTQVLLEKYLDRPRHIEVQIFSDQLGHCIHLFERDCSVQRRHQKVLEEAPAPHLTEAQRAQMGKTAIAVAQAVGYVGAGTVEFIVSADGRFYFMEMNTRLQVEHPVTEMITGQDLVAWQIHVAAGQPLPLQQHELARYGHAIEARIYAENPEKDFLPATGTLDYLHLPVAIEFSCANAVIQRSTSSQDHASLLPVPTKATIQPSHLRIDSGVCVGDTISPFYDPMIAKLIAWGETREQALATLHQALAAFHVVGVQTNLAFLSRLVNCSDFAQAQLDTSLIARNQAILFPTPAPLTWRILAGAVAALLVQEQQQAASYSPSPWTCADGWRLGVAHQRSLQFLYNEEKILVTLRYAKEGLYIDALDNHSMLYFTHQENCYHIQLDTEQYPLNIFTKADHFYIYSDQASAQLRYLDPLVQKSHDDHAENQLTAPMPGKIIAIHAHHGQAVNKGMPLLVMEAMKMEHTISAPRDGVIESIHYMAGEQVAEGAQLLSLVMES